MKTSIYLLIILISASSSFAQVNIDSLLQVWNDESKHDTVRLNAMNTAAKEGYLYSQPDSAFYFAQKAYEMAKKTGYVAQQAAAINVQGFSFYIKGEYDKALGYYAEGMALYDGTESDKNLGALYNNTALIHINRGDNVEALDFFFRSLRIMKKLDNQFGMAIILNNIGIIYMDQGDHARAIDNYSRSVKIQEALGDNRLLSNTINNIGNIYQDQRDFDKAMEYYQRSLDLTEENADDIGKAQALNNIGLILTKTKEYENALDHHLQSLEIYEAVGDEQKTAILLGNIGNIYRHLDKVDKAFEFYEKSSTLSLALGDPSSASASLGNLAHLYRETGNPSKAYEYDLRSLEFAKEAHEPRAIRDAANELYLFLKTTGNTTKALEMHELYITMRDSIMSEENQRETIRTEFSREAEQRDNEIAILNLENEKKQAETAAERNKRLFTLGISGSLILMILGGGFFFQRSRKQKHQVEITRAELQKNLVENDFLRSQLDPHFIKNALFNIDRLLENGRTEEAQRYTARFQKLMNLTLQNATQQLIGLDEELEMMEQYLALEADRLENRLIWTVKVADDVNPEEVELPPMILQPLVENALKHGADMKDGKGEVKLEVRVENERIVCVVEDNGSGISPTPALPQGEGDAAPVKTSHGLRITRERLEMFSRLNLADARLEMLNTGNGTRAVVSFVV